MGRRICLIYVSYVIMVSNGNGVNPQPNSVNGQRSTVNGKPRESDPA